jgi:DNA-binding beta-propeller fold protein YncE
MGDKASSGPVVILEGDRYRVEPEWIDKAQAPPLDGVSQVAVDRHDNVFIFQRSDPPVVVLDPKGNLVRTWGSGLVIDAHGIFITRDDRVLLVDRDGHRVLCMTILGEMLFAIGDASSPRLQAPFNHPADVAVAPDGSIYVADGYGNSCIHHFTGDGVWIHSWGRAGRGPGEFTTPHAVWVLEDGRVLATDRENDRVQLFEPGGRFLEEWSDHYHPMDIYVDARGAIHITDQIPRLSRLDTTGRLVGRCKPVPIGAHGVWGDSMGNLFLAEVAPMNRITRLTRLPDGTASQLDSRD